MTHLFQELSQTLLFCLSLENNSTLTSTSVILDQFGEEFSIPTVSHVESLQFDSNSKPFCLKKARDHAEFSQMYLSCSIYSYRYFRHRVRSLELVCSDLVDYTKCYLCPQVIRLITHTLWYLIGRLAQVLHYHLTMLL